MSIGERIRHEVREIGLVTLFFLAAFLLFLSLKKLLLEEYEVQVTVLSTAVIGALVVAKVVVVLDHTSFGDWFEGQRLFFHVLWRSLAYTGVVFVVSLAERFIDQYREAGQASAALSQMWADGDVYHFLAMNMCIGLSFLVYNSFTEIDRKLGKGGLRRLFLGTREGSVRS